MDSKDFIRASKAIADLGIMAKDLAFAFIEAEKANRKLLSIFRVKNPNRKWYQFWKPKTIITIKPL